MKGLGERIGFGSKYLPELKMLIVKKPYARRGAPWQTRNLFHKPKPCFEI